MTNPPPTEFTLSILHEAGTMAVHVAGELDYDTSDDLIDRVVEHLTGHVRPHDVHLDFRDLTWIDSTGLSALLMIRRHTDAVGATLHLDNRPEVLERMLRITNVLDHLTAPATGANARGVEGGGGLAGAGST
ncbi:STAS domain-containing protein [Streptomyces sp. NPDC015220]|uniref:STAS domain-containing protein n=1 Tax=Streptomyces sp. NPDC015220 TaxID=3364947 RepID=UPI0037009BD9